MVREYTALVMNKGEMESDNLTNGHQKSYSRGEGDDFMTESTTEDTENSSSPQEDQQATAEEKQAKQRVAAEEKRRLEKAWQAYNSRKETKEKKLSSEEQKIRKENGKMPPITQEAKKLLESSKMGVFSSVSSKKEEILRENGFSQDEIDTLDPSELMDMLAEMYEKSGESPAETARVGEKPEDYINPTVLKEQIRSANNEQLKAILLKIDAEIQKTGKPEDLDVQFVAQQMAEIRGLINEEKLSPAQQAEATRRIETAGTDEEREEIKNLKNQKKLSSVDQTIAEEMISQLSQLRGNFGSLKQMAENAERGYEKQAALAKEILNVFSNKELREELKENNPDFNRFAELRHLMDEVVDPTSSGGEMLTLAHMLTNEEGTVIKGERLVFSDRSKKILYEWLVERVVSIPDKDLFEDHYKLGTFYTTANLDSLIDIARRNERKFKVEGKTNFHTYLRRLSNYRASMHELSRSLKTADEYKEYVVKELSNSGFDFVNNRMEGVAGIIRLYEKSYSSKLKDSGMQLTGTDIEEAERDLRRAVEDQFEKGELKDKSNTRVLTKWEKDRALNMAKVLFSGSQRRAVYTGFGKLNPDMGKFYSAADEYIVRSLYDWKTLSLRLFASDEGSRRFMENLFKHARSLNEGKFEKGIFGIDSDILISNYFGAYDLQTNPWRSELLFLGNQLFADKNGREQTLEMILSEKNRQYSKEEKDTLTGKTVKEEIYGHNELKDEDKTLYSQDVRQHILGQRTYLSALASSRYGSNFDGALKADIWRKRISLMPSTAVTLLPDEILENSADKEIWENMKSRIWRAEERRLSQESLEEKQWSDVFAEAERFERGKAGEGEFRYEFINEYCSGAEFSDAEREFLKRVIDGIYDGKDRDMKDKNGNPIGLAERLAKTQMSFNLIIDDAPEIAWEKKGGKYGNAGFYNSDFIRLLASDQEAMKKGYEQMIEITELPQLATWEHFKKAVDLVGEAMGRDGAQARLLPFIATYTSMGSQDLATEIYPGAYTFKRKFDLPTSDFERSFKKTYVSMNTDARKEFLTKLLQVRALSNENFEKMRKETRTTQVWYLLMMFKMWAQLIGAEAAYEMFKSFLPEDIGKSL